MASSFQLSSVACFISLIKACAILTCSMQLAAETRGGFSLDCWSSSSDVCDPVRISPVALRLGSEMDPYRRDLTNILLSYLISDSFGPVLGARAWSCKTANNYLGLSRLRNTLETFGRRCLRLPPGLSMFCITFLLYGLLGLTILDYIYSSIL